jgi:tRNA wybutosine-synthesizing protein 1
MNENLIKILRKQRYKLIGNHSGVKLCHWMRQKLFYNRPCYKEIFYGIQTHRCLQFTPAVAHCTHKCLFCWRYQYFTETSISDWDNPEFILEQAINAQRELISGFKGDARCDLELWQEAQHPNQVAISLAGEPTLYPQLDEFIELCTKRGWTTFLVSNGTLPKVLEELNTLPTQLYISVVAPTHEIYKRLCIPAIQNGFEAIIQTLELLPSLTTRTVIRHTLVDGWNLGYEDAYAKLDKLAEPDFIEPKGYVFVGYSRQRMTLANMPSHEKIRAFGIKLANILGYNFTMERTDSRVVLLTRNSLSSKINSSGKE